MIGALGDVADAHVSEHVWHVIIRVELEQHRHLAAASWACRVLGGLDPPRPSTEFVTLRSSHDLLDFDVASADRYVHANGWTSKMVGLRSEVVAAEQAAVGVVLGVGFVAKGLPADDRYCRRQLTTRIDRRCQCLVGDHSDEARFVREWCPSSVRPAIWVPVRFLVGSPAGAVEELQHAVPVVVAGERVEVELNEELKVSPAELAGRSDLPGLEQRCPAEL